MINSSCRDCVFAEYIGKTQVGCNFDNRIEKFKQQTTVDECYDEEKEFYVIKDRVCNSIRNEDNFKPGDDKYKLVRNAIKVKIDYFVLINEESKEKLKLTVDSILKQEPRYNSITFINNNCWPRLKFRTFVDELKLEKWSITNCMEKFTNEKCINLAYPRCKGMYYSVIESGGEYKDYASFVENHINNELKPLTAITNKDHNFWLIQVVLHKALMYGADKTKETSIFDLVKERVDHTTLNYADCFSN